GEHNLTIKVSVPDLRTLEEFVIEKLSKIQGLEYTRSSLITETIKEHYDTSLRPGYGVRIKCHTCEKEIRGEMVKVKSYEHDFFFCCTSCASIFKKERESLTKSKAKAAASGGVARLHS
ncbi:MAG: Lrp/AsnC ligand binding domain-containing protein, partial [Nitrososphaerales archaeon]